MSWRFRKAFKVLPGVKLNLTSRGLSATFGAAPFSVNVGPGGTYANVSIPGTGISDRQRIGGSSLRPSGIDPPTREYPVGSAIPSPQPPIPILPSSATEVHSASTELLTTESLERLRRLLTDAYQERAELTQGVSSATLELTTATRRYQKWQRGFLMKRLFKQSFIMRKEAADTAIAKLAELQEQLRLTTVATEITVDREQAEPYYRMRDALASLSECQKIWNILAEKEIDRIVERSTANIAITRNPVAFSLGSCDLIHWEQQVPHLQNHTGGDMFVYPGLVLYRASKQAFALIDFREVSLTYVSTNFTETEAIPSDGQVVGHTWAKANKDGSPDRRFASNYQIPVVHYGSLLFSSPGGLDVRYLCSNAGLAERFARAWAAFRSSFSSLRSDETESTKTRRTNEPPDGFKAARDNFKAAQAAFEKNATGGQLRHSELVAYISAVAQFIDAAKDHVEKSNASPRAKTAFRRAVQNIEAARAHLEECINGGLTNLTESLVPYVNSVVAFLNAIPRS